MTRAEPQFGSSTTRKPQHPQWTLTHHCSVGSGTPNHKSRPLSPIVTGGPARSPPSDGGAVGHTRSHARESPARLTRPDRAYDAGVSDIITALVGQAMVSFENARLSADVRRLAATDGLTGIANRTAFFESAGRALADARRDGH